MNYDRKTWIIYHTEGRECMHADKGCCPLCLDPMHVPSQERRDYLKRQAEHRVGTVPQPWPSR